MAGACTRAVHFPPSSSGSLSYQVTWRPYFTRGGRVCPLVLFLVRPSALAESLASTGFARIASGPWVAALGAYGHWQLPPTPHCGFCQRVGVEPADLCWGTVPKASRSFAGTQQSRPEHWPRPGFRRCFVMQMKGRSPARCPPPLTTL